MKRETFDSSRDRFEADFIVNKLVIERERRENYLENWRGISFRRNLRIVEYGLNFHISSLVTRLSYLSASNSLIIIILEIPTDNTIILFREFLPLLFSWIVKLCCNFIVCMVVHASMNFILVARYDVFLEFRALSWFFPLRPWRNTWQWVERKRRMGKEERRKGREERKKET